MKANLQHYHGPQAKPVFLTEAPTYVTTRGYRKHAALIGGAFAALALAAVAAVFVLTL